MLKKAVLTILVSLSFMTGPRAHALVGLETSVVWVPVFAGLVVFGAIEVPTATMFMKSKVDSLEFYGGTILAAAAGGLAFNASTGQQEFGAISPALAQKARMTRDEVTALNNELPILNGLYQSAGQEALKAHNPNAAAEFLQSNKDCMSIEAQHALRKYFQLLVATK